MGAERVMCLAEDVPWYEEGVVKLEMQVWWTATGLGCAWDICNMDRSAAQADRALACGIILQVDDESRVDGCGILCGGTAALSAPRKHSTLVYLPRLKGILGRRLVHDICDETAVLALPAWRAGDGHTGRTAPMGTQADVASIRRTDLAVGTPERVCICSITYGPG